MLEPLLVKITASQLKSVGLWTNHFEDAFLVTESVLSEVLVGDYWDYDGQLSGEGEIKESLFGVPIAEVSVVSYTRACVYLCMCLCGLLRACMFLHMCAYVCKLAFICSLCVSSYPSITYLCRTSASSIQLIICITSNSWEACTTTAGSSTVKSEQMIRLQIYSRCV